MNGKKYYAKHREKNIENTREWRKNNPEKVKLKQRNWLKKNRAKQTAYENVRRAMRMNACLYKDDAGHMEAIQDLYVASKALSDYTGTKYNVDHIDPYKGRNKEGVWVSCGLHVWWNLKIIPQTENNQKWCKLEV